jgi:hypothetical protein
MVDQSVFSSLMEYKQLTTFRMTLQLAQEWYKCPYVPGLHATLITDPVPHGIIPQPAQSAIFSIQRFLKVARRHLEEVQMERWSFDQWHATTRSASS